MNEMLEFQYTAQTIPHQPGFEAENHRVFDKNQKIQAAQVDDHRRFLADSLGSCTG